MHVVFGFESGVVCTCTYQNPESMEMDYPKQAEMLQKARRGWVTKCWFAGLTTELELNEDLPLYTFWS